MKILIVRHAKAENKSRFARSGRSDGLRPLTKDGRKEMKKAARGLKKEVPEIYSIVSSPLVRAVQTADILGKTYRKARRSVDSGLVPGAEWHSLMKSLRGRPQKAVVALVGHEPDLSRLQSWLLTGRKESFVELKKGAAALLDFSGPAQPGAGRLLWQLRPSHLKKLTR